MSSPAVGLLLGYLLAIFIVSPCERTGTIRRYPRACPKGDRAALYVRARNVKKRNVANEMVVEAMTL